MSDALCRLKSCIPFSLSEDLRQVIEEYELEINRRTDAILSRDRAYGLLRAKVAELDAKLEQKTDLLGKANALARVRGERVEELLAMLSATTAPVAQKVPDRIETAAAMLDGIDDIAIDGARRTLLGRAMTLRIAAAQAQEEK